MPHLSLHPTLSTCSSDTILRGVLQEFVWVSNRGELITYMDGLHGNLLPSPRRGKATGRRQKVGRSALGTLCLAKNGAGVGCQAMSQPLLKIGYDRIYLLHPYPSSQEEGSKLPCTPFIYVISSPWVLNHTNSCSTLFFFRVPVTSRLKRKVTKKWCSTACKRQFFHSFLHFVRNLSFCHNDSGRKQAESLERDGFPPYLCIVKRTERQKNSWFLRHKNKRTKGLLVLDITTKKIKLIKIIKEQKLKPKSRKGNKELWNSRFQWTRWRR